MEESTDDAKTNDDKIVSNEKNKGKNGKKQEKTNKEFPKEETISNFEEMNKGNVKNIKKMEHNRKIVHTIFETSSKESTKRLLTQGKESLKVDSNEEGQYSRKTRGKYKARLEKK